MRAFATLPAARPIVVWAYFIYKVPIGDCMIFGRSIWMAIWKLTFCESVEAIKPRLHGTV